MQRELNVKYTGKKTRTRIESYESITGEETSTRKMKILRERGKKTKDDITFMTKI